MVKISAVNKTTRRRHRHRTTEPARWLLIGTGSRGLGMFARPLIAGRFKRRHVLVGLCDVNPLRAAAAAELLGADLPTGTDPTAAIRELRPDGAIITSRDSTHAGHIIACLRAGLRVVSEKPLCVDARQCRAILAAEKKYRSRTGARCLVTHNVRYMPAVELLRKQLNAGAIGKLLFVRFREYLDRRHGADYFRRWHRRKENSGGLLVHKACHHFDALNYLAGSLPDELSARGELLFYGRNGKFRGRRCLDCRHAKKCPFYVNMFRGKKTVRQLYREAEAADGYFRDGCVFAQEIDIEDHAAVLYSYRNGVRVQYDLAAFCSYEGWRVELEGTEGRLELVEYQNTAFAAGAPGVHGSGRPLGTEVTLFKPGRAPRRLRIPRRAGTHGGADTGLLNDFFGRPLDAPPTPQQAPLEEAVQAVLIGHAANVSIARGGRPVRVQEFLRRG